MDHELKEIQDDLASVLERLAAYIEQRPAKTVHSFDDPEPYILKTEQVDRETLAMILYRAANGPWPPNLDEVITRAQLTEARLDRAQTDDSMLAIYREIIEKEGSGLPLSPHSLRPFALAWSRYVDRVDKHFGGLEPNKHPGRDVYRLKAWAAHEFFRWRDKEPEEWPHGDKGYGKAADRLTAQWGRKISTRTIKDGLKVTGLGEILKLRESQGRHGEPFNHEEKQILKEYRKRNLRPLQD